jgi:hypothetical protein
MNFTRGNKSFSISKPGVEDNKHNSGNHPLKQKTPKIGGLQGKSLNNPVTPEGLEPSTNSGL